MYIGLPFSPLDGTVAIKNQILFDLFLLTILKEKAQQTEKKKGKLWSMEVQVRPSN